MTRAHVPRCDSLYVDCDFVTYKKRIQCRQCIFVSVQIIERDYFPNGTEILMVSRRDHMRDQVVLCFVFLVVVLR